MESSLPQVFLAKHSQLHSARRIDRIPGGLDEAKSETAWRTTTLQSGCCGTSLDYLGHRAPDDLW